MANYTLSGGSLFLQFTVAEACELSNMLPKQVNNIYLGVDVQSVFNTFIGGMTAERREEWSVFEYKGEWLTNPWNADTSVEFYLDNASVLSLRNVINNVWQINRAISPKYAERFAVIIERAKDIENESEEEGE